MPGMIDMLCCAQLGLGPGANTSHRWLTSGEPKCDGCVESPLEQLIDIHHSVHASGLPVTLRTDRASTSRLLCQNRHGAKSE